MVPAAVTADHATMMPVKLFQHRSSLLERFADSSRFRITCRRDEVHEENALHR